MASTIRDRRTEDQSRADHDDEERENASQEQEDGRDGQQKGRGQRVKSSHIITEHIEAGVPIDDVFRQWTEYDKWSEIFKAESASTDEGDSSGDEEDSSDGEQDGSSQEVQVTAKIGPSRRQWTAEITATEPPRRIRWRSKGPLQAVGATSFHRLDDRLTRIMVEIEYKPAGFLEVVGNFFRMQRRRVRRDLRLFKNYVELERDSNEGDDGDDGDDGKEA